MTLKKTSHIIIFSYSKSFDYYKIGGLESFYRRIGNILSEVGCQVSFVFYGSDENKLYKITDSIFLRYFKDFYHSLEFLRAEASLVLDNYMLKKHRLAYALFRIKHQKLIYFGHIFAGIPASLQKKIIYISQKTVPYNGPVISLSYTIHNNLLKFGITTDVMLPPLPQSYNLPTIKKDHRLKLTFMGRFDDHKGIQEVVNLFQNISDNKFPVDLHINGYFGHGQINKGKLEKSFDSISNLEVQTQVWEKWSPQIDGHVIKLLQSTDILVLPYRDLKGTMDPPLLILEGMACGCTILTTDVGSVKEFYGDSKFICDHSNFIENAYNIISGIILDRQILDDEKKRVAKKVQLLQNNKQSVVECLVNQYRDIDV